MSVVRAIATATVVTVFLIHHASASTYPLNASSLNSGAFYVTEGPMYGGEGAECSTRLELASGSGSVWLGFVQNNTKNVALLLDVHKACSGDWITIAEKDTAFKNYPLPGTSLRNPNVVEIKWLGPSADVAVYAVVAKCTGSDITLGKGSNISFKGARGYLPGRLWSFLPFWGVLYANYCLLLLLYLALYCKNRAHVLDVQRYIVVVMVAGLVEPVEILQNTFSDRTHCIAQLMARILIPAECSAVS